MKSREMLFWVDRIFSISLLLGNSICIKYNEKDTQRRKEMVEQI